MEEPSKPTPSVKLSRSRADGGTEKCCHDREIREAQVDHDEFVVLDGLQDLVWRFEMVSHRCLLRSHLDS